MGTPKLPATLWIINGGVRCKFVALVFKTRFISVDGDDQVSLNIPLCYIVKAFYSRHASCMNVGRNFTNEESPTNRIDVIDVLLW
jgi:hypothetical protein